MRIVYLFELSKVRRHQDGPAARFNLFRGRQDQEAKEQIPDDQRLQKPKRLRLIVGGGRLCRSVGVLSCLENAETYQLKRLVEVWGVSLNCRHD